MGLNNKNGLSKLKKLNIVDAERNTAVTMCNSCHCSCYCSPGEHEHNKHGATYNNALYVPGAGG
jgi:hypothetical protein